MDGLELRVNERSVDQWRQRLSRGPSQVSGQALELFAQNPFWTVTRLAERLEVAFTTAQRAIERMEAEGIVTLEGEARRNRVYCARPILEILEQPPQLPGVAGGR